MTISTPPTRLTLDELGEGLGRAATVLRANAAAAGLEAPVPTCPEWSVRDLVAHIGMVHRWAASQLRSTPVEDADALEREGLASPDLLGWFDDGATALLQAIVDAPDDLDAFVFLREAPAPKVFWTRRQCHETTIHAVDALAARLGRAPRPEETWISPAIALDGIDELLRGFVPRPKQGVSPEVATTVLVCPDDSDVAWLLDLAPDRPARTARIDRASERLPRGEHVLTGPPVGLYLRLWSRADPPTSEPADGFERWWRSTVTVTWR
ncbi:hypothetical protein N865_08775 [Intrasporangium oryzae NRRL B-24470]|uniref:Mycothiol-dependent maleylpyruvate isomerase metal-binding domain-containing protein n=1 Tax=Intrasporangium oryzae NRRL B-24470 TaxID=1386089 RepID=W9GBX2_9MICO|nr:maleylpyruvate isomerase N-terminal domain-containing protein [Intrasporangium oryzae]EWT03540.1 hypothetical protein N865_08775 [Intrasporangium oryzae NRRL B-24470]